jgi:epoxyqueuosine reductase
MGTYSESILVDLGQHGLQGRVVPVQHVQDLRHEIEGQYTQGQLSEEFYRERLQFYRFDDVQGLPAAKSIIVMAIPRPQTPVNFVYHRKSITLTLPPTYAGYNAITRQTGDILSSILAPHGFRTASTLLPLKLLAACSGLAEYGRNNVCYIPGMGSFFQLAAYYTDLPGSDSMVQDPWTSPRLMKRCETCRACLIQCPTNAIVDDRILLHADRCLSFHNERFSRAPFPAWIDPRSHNSLMGCMLCQRYCPEDKSFIGWFEDSVDFSEEETRLLLEGATQDQLPAETVAKLEHLELLGDLDKFPRNLSVLITRFG